MANDHLQVANNTPLGPDTTTHKQHQQKTSPQPPRLAPANIEPIHDQSTTQNTTPGKPDPSPIRPKGLGSRESAATVENTGAAAATAGAGKHKLRSESVTQIGRTVAPASDKTGAVLAAAASAPISNKGNGPTQSNRQLTGRQRVISNGFSRPSATHEPLSPADSMKKMKQDESETKEQSSSSTTATGGQDSSPSFLVQAGDGETSLLLAQSSPSESEAAATAIIVDTTMLVAADEGIAPAAAGTTGAGNDGVSSGRDAGDGATDPAAVNNNCQLPSSVTTVSIVIDSAEEAKLTEDEGQGGKNVPAFNVEEYEPVYKCFVEEAPTEVDEVQLANPEIKLQSILDYVKNRRHEFAKLLEEHAEIVHEINKFEGGVTS